MITLLSLLFFTLLLVVAIVLIFTGINGNGKSASEQNRARRLHGQVNLLLETLGMKPDGQLPEEVAKLASGGRKIEAIKRFRELTGADLKAAKDAVEGQEDLALLEQKLDRVLRELALNETNQTGEETPRAVKEAPVALAEAERLVASGQLIPAIKEYKDRTGCSLLEAKEIVEQIQLRQKSR